MPEPLEKQLSGWFSHVHRPVFHFLEPGIASESLAFPVLYPKVICWGGALGGQVLLKVR
jgi:hypothetical protein